MDPKFGPALLMNRKTVSNVFTDRVERALTSA